MHRSRFFSWGWGGGVQARWPENSLDNLFFYFSPQLILQFTEGAQWFYGFITEKTVLFQGSRVGPTFSRGGESSFFQGGGVQILISIEPHITCDFPGGGGSGLTITPLDPQMKQCRFRSDTA